jgi:hypothetical protein
MRTKITFISVIAMLLVLSPCRSNAQYRSFILGIKAAPTISWLKPIDKHYDSEGIKVGFNWGITSEFYFAKNYAFATGLNFIYHNGSLSYPDMRQSTQVLLTRDYRLRYLEIPAVLKMKTNEMGPFRYYGQIGLGLGVRMTSKARDEYKVGNQTFLDDFENIDSQTRLFKASLIIGAGIEYPFDNNTSAVFGINFNNGFTNALKGDNAVIANTKNEARPNFIEFSLGLMF